MNYKVQGQGEPLLMIMGLSFSLLDWGTEFPELLAKHYKVILFDNRDAGQTSQATKPYTIAQMAADAAGLLGALGEAKAHVFGISLGGMIAQHFALNHADKLNKLILGCTMAGGRCSHYADISGVFGSNLLDVLFTPQFIQTNQTRLADFQQITTPLHSRGNALTRQLQALSTHNTCDRLGQITAPTLVMTGDQDPVIPPENSTYLANNIPGARLEMISDASHAFCFSHPDTAAASAINFLKDG